VVFIRALRDKADTLPKVQLSSVQLILIKINILRRYIDLVKEVEKMLRAFYFRASLMLTPLYMRIRVRVLMTLISDLNI